MAMVESFGADSWHVSITHDAGVAVAVVILESSGSNCFCRLDSFCGGTIDSRSSLKKTRSTLPTKVTFLLQVCWRAFKTTQNTSLVRA